MFAPPGKWPVLRRRKYVYCLQTPISICNLYDGIVTYKLIKNAHFQGFPFSRGIFIGVKREPKEDPKGSPAHAWSARKGPQAAR